MNLELNGKIVLVTGGSKGIGLAAALGFLAEGARVAICSRSHANLANAAVRDSRLVTYQADLIDADAAADLVRSVESQLGPIDILVNSAGAAKRAAPADLTPAIWRAAMDAKYFSYINVIDPLIKHMAARGQGVVINVIGNGGKVASPEHLSGGAANAALMLATAGLAKAYASQGVRVVGINPGLTETDRVAEGMRVTAEATGISLDAAYQKGVAAIPFGRLARPDEIADTIVYLASVRASYISGAIITMDGAQTATVV